MKRMVLGFMTIVFMWGGWGQAKAETYTLSILVKTGDVVDGRTIDSVLTASLNNIGDSVFASGFSSPRSASGIFSPSTLLVEQNDIIAGKELLLFVGPNGSPRINDSGKVAFRAEFVGVERPIGIFTLDSLVAEVGQIVGTKTLSHFSDILSINNQGDIAYVGYFDDGGRGLFLSGIPLVLPGDTIGGRTLANIGLHPGCMNETGDVPFIGFFDGVSGVFTQNGLVAQPGDTIGGKELINFRGTQVPCINDGGDVVFRGTFAGTEGIFTQNALWVQQGDVIGGKMLTSLDDPQISNTGEIVFRGFFEGGSGIFTPSAPVALPGDVVDGKILASFPSLVTMNDVGDFAFTAYFSDGTRGIVIAKKAGRTLSCSGFEAPMDNGAVKVKKNRVLPLKAQLFDTDNNPVTGADITAPPVIHVMFDDGISSAIDVTDQALPAGEGTGGNQFEYDDVTQRWRFNLKTMNYTATGTYTITMASADSSDTINPSCTAVFVRE